MGKYSRDLDERLEKKVKDLAASIGFQQMGITIEAVRLKKSKTYGEVVKGNDLVTLFTNDPDLVCVALYEDLFIDNKTGENRVDEETQNYWIEALLSQISYDNEKDKVVITKPDINISSGMYHKYKNVAVQKEELAILTLQQMADQKKKEKEEKKAEREAKKKNKKF